MDRWSLTAAAAVFALAAIVGAPQARAHNLGELHPGLGMGTGVRIGIAEGFGLGRGYGPNDGYAPTDEDGCLLKHLVTEDGVVVLQRVCN